LGPPGLPPVHRLAADASMGISSNSTATRRTSSCILSPQKQHAYSELETLVLCLRTRQIWHGTDATPIAAVDLVAECEVGLPGAAVATCRSRLAVCTGHQLLFQCTTYTNCLRALN